MALLVLPRNSIMCKCGHIVVLVERDGTRKIRGILKQDSGGTYIICPKCGKRTYI